MLSGPRLLIRAVLLLGTARCSSAAPDTDWSTPGAPGHPSMTRSLPAHRLAQTWGPAARSPDPLQDASAGREGLMMGYYRLPSKELFPANPKEIQNLIADSPRTQTDPNRTGTDPSSEPNRTGTDPSSEPNRTGTDPSSDPNRTETHLSSEPYRTGTHPSSEPNRTGTHPSSEPNRIGTQPSSEPNRTGTHFSSEPYRTGTRPSSELSRTDSLLEQTRTVTQHLSEHSRTGAHRSSEPNRTGTHPSSESNRIDSLPEPNRTVSPSEPYRTKTDSPSEPYRIGTDSISDPKQTETEPRSEPIRTATEPFSEPNRTVTEPLSEPSRTATEPFSEPIRTKTNSPSESNTTRTVPAPEPNRTYIPSLSADPVKNQTYAEPGQTEHHLGPHMHNRSEPDWMDLGQTSSAAGITQKSATQRHLNKRTPHMDTTYISTTRGGDRTLLSVTNDSNVSDITEVPSMYPTNTGSHKSGTSSRNITEESPTTVHGYRNATEDAEVRNTSSQAAASVPSTYPLQTPSYMVTTYPSSTSHHISNSTFPFTSVPVTAASTRGSPTTMGVTPNTSFIEPLSSSPSDLSGVESSSSVLTSAASTSVTSSSPPVEVTSQTQQPPLPVSSLSPIPSTFISSMSPPLAETSSNTNTTETPHPVTTSTPRPPAPTTSLPPFLNTESSSGDGTEKNKTFVSSISPTANNTSKFVSPETPQVVTERRSQEETRPTTQDVTTALKIMETQTTMMSTEGTQGVTVGTQLIGTPTQTIDNIPSTTSTDNPLVPKLHETTQKIPLDTMTTTGPGTAILTTADLDVVTETTTIVACNTEPPRPETTVSTKGKKTFISPTPPTTTPSVRYAATTIIIPPTVTHPKKTPTAAASPCSSSPCQNGGLCVESRVRKGYRCDCPAAWSGELCNTDVDECLSSPCPALSTCVNSRGSFSCQCPLGYLLEKGAGCVLVRTFLGHIEIPWSFLDGSDVKDSRLQQIKEDIVRILNSSFSSISGYYQSSVSSDSNDNLIVQNLFSMESNVTMFDLSRGLQSYAKVCETSPQRPTSCQLVLHLQHRIRAVSLCQVRNPGCDNETAVCADPAGVALCHCKPGYFKYSKTDHSCRACDDGYKLENGACVRCPFGLGGFNCSNPYQLITVIIAAAGGGLLLILVIALVVTCCRKSKHDISKLIFKSGDFQMSPYAEYPKTQRSSEWGRETIEMQENGSTKNLLQMTDVYYSPGLRNSEIERNGLYPYSGLPGSRHSCIYPGQYNPSFINEENRRRDYF